MFIPIGDNIQRKTFPVFNYLIVAACVAIQVWSNDRNPQEVLAYSMVPSGWNIQTLFTHMFLHASWAHLIGNMLFLMIAGDNVEDRLGHIPYLVFYLAAGVAAALAHAVTTAHVNSPMVGASGAISGIMGAYLGFFPTSKVRIFIVMFMTSIHVHTWYVIGLWILSQVLLYQAIMKGEGSNIAVMAHLGGFAFGLVAALLLNAFGKKSEGK